VTAPTGLLAAASRWKCKQYLKIRANFHYMCQQQHIIFSSFMSSKYW